jgi:signal transduction histidine kinase/CheY-like chemotaxis protein
VLAGATIVDAEVNPRGHQALGVRPTDVVALVVVLVSLVVVQRRRPLVAVGLVTAACLACLVDGTQQPIPVVALLFLFYTYAGVTPRAPVVRAVAAVCVPLYLVGVWRSGVWLSWGNTGGLEMVGIGAALGDATRNRRAYVAEVELRARRAEEDRDQEAARRVVQERMRIARELHDLVAHHIAVIKVQASGARHVLEDRPEMIEPSLDHIIRSADEVLREIASLVGLLRTAGPTGPDRTPTSGLAGLDAMLDHMSGAGLQVTHQQTGVDRGLPAVVDLAAYRIVQEALTNAHKHGDGSAYLRIGYAADGISVRVVNPVRPGDHGAPRDGFGITGMRRGQGPPAARSPPGPSTAAGSRCGHGSGRCARRMSVRVVLADDQPLIRAGFRMFLASAPDIEVVGEAATGREAVETVRTARADVVLMDIRMPDLDGIEATRQIAAATTSRGYASSCSRRSRTTTASCWPCVPVRAASSARTSSRQSWCTRSASSLRVTRCCHPRPPAPCSPGSCRCPRRETCRTPTASAGSPSANARSSPSSPTGCRTSRSPSGCTCPRSRSRPTSAGPWASWRPETGHSSWCSPTRAGSCAPAAPGDELASRARARAVRGAPGGRRRAAGCPYRGDVPRRPDRARPARAARSTTVLLTGVPALLPAVLPALLLALLTTPLGAVPAAAHARFTGSDPAEGAQVPALPAVVVMSYSEELAPQFVEAAVITPDGTTVPATASVDGLDLTVDLDGADLGDADLGDADLGERTRRRSSGRHVAGGGTGRQRGRPPGRAHDELRRPGADRRHDRRHDRPDHRGRRPERVRRAGHRPRPCVPRAGGDLPRHGPDLRRHRRAAPVGRGRGRRRPGAGGRVGAARAAATPAADGLR